MTNVKLWVPIWIMLGILRIIVKGIHMKIAASLPALAMLGTLSVEPAKK